MPRIHGKVPLRMTPQPRSGTSPLIGSVSIIRNPYPSSENPKTNIAKSIKDSSSDTGNPFASASDEKSVSIILNPIFKTSPIDQGAFQPIARRPWMLPLFEYHPQSAIVVCILCRVHIQGMILLSQYSKSDAGWRPYTSHPSHCGKYLDLSCSCHEVLCWVRNTWKPVVPSAYSHG